MHPVNTHTYVQNSAKEKLFFHFLFRINFIWEPICLLLTNTHTEIGENAYTFT